MVDQALAPVFNQRGVVLIDANQVALDEGHMPARFDQQVRQILGFQAASLGQGFAALGGQAFDPASMETQPASPSRRSMSGFQRSIRVWTPNTTSRCDQGFQQGTLRQEDLVNEVQVADALRDQVVDLRQQDRQVTAAILVAEVDLGAEAAVVGAAA